MSLNFVGRRFGKYTILRFTGTQYECSCTCGRIESKGGTVIEPTPEAIKAARKASGLTQTAASALVYSTCRAWQKWEGGEARMHPAMFELFLIKTQGNARD